MKYSEVDIPQTITALTGLVAAVGVILNLYWTKKVGVKADSAANSADKAAKTAALTAAETKHEVQHVRRLVNGQHTNLLRTNALAARRLADLKIMTDAPDKVVFIALAQEAERVLEEHLAADREDAKRRLVRMQEERQNLQAPEI